MQTPQQDSQHTMIVPYIAYYYIEGQGYVPVIQYQQQQLQLPYTYQQQPQQPNDKPKKKKKDPSAPKNPLSAYLFFVTEQRAKLAGKSNKSFSDLAKDLGNQWKEMSEEDKEPYKEAARKDKERYQFEKKAYERRKQSASNVMVEETSESEEEAEIPFAQPVV
jgi:hypothetical protein